MTTVEEMLEAMRNPKPRNKYGAVRTRGYASKAEANYAARLELEQRAGHVVLWLEQVPVKLPGNIKYVCDFVVLMRDGSLRFVEVKGVSTAAFKLKMKLLREAKPEIYARLEILT